MTRKKLFIIGILIITFIIGLSLFGYSKYYNSPENKISRLLVNEIYDDLNVSDSRIEAEKIMYKLNDSWKFNHFDINPIKISYNAYIAERTYWFKKENTNQYFQIVSRYYYDDDTHIPIPMKENVATWDNDKKVLKELKTSTLWDGDFDVFCVKPKE